MRLYRIDFDEYSVIEQFVAGYCRPSNKIRRVEFVGLVLGGSGLLSCVSQLIDDFSNLPA